MLTLKIIQGNFRQLMLISIFLFVKSTLSFGGVVRPSKVWILSVGIDDYSDIQFENSKSDAESYVGFFKKQYQIFLTSIKADTLVKSYLFLNKEATKEAITSALKEIASKAASQDYFIFTFAGQSYFSQKDSANYSTYLFPFDITSSKHSFVSRQSKDSFNLLEHAISVKALQEYSELIPAESQLFICEAGSSAKFKTEFIKTIFNSSKRTSNTIKKNIVLIVPTIYGLDNSNCDSKKGPINYCITSLDSSKCIYEIFDKRRSGLVVSDLETKLIQCDNSHEDYFYIFFVKEFLNQYQEILGRFDKRR